MDKNTKTVFLKDFPDCCFTCKFGIRYYGSIRCEKKNIKGIGFRERTVKDLFPDVDSICNYFERKRI